MQIALCEDDPELLLLYNIIIKDALKKGGDRRSKVVLSTGNPNEMRTFISKNTDPRTLYILDIEFANSKLKGLDLAELVRDQSLTSLIIFISSHSEFYPLTIERKVSPFDYIDKGKGLDSLKRRLTKDIKNGIDQLKTDQSKLTFKYSFNGTPAVVKIDKILYFKITKEIVFMYAVDSIVSIRTNISEIRRALPNTFVMLSNFFVNTKNIKKINKDQNALQFSNDMELHLDRKSIEKLLTKKTGMNN